MIEIVLHALGVPHPEGVDGLVLTYLSNLNLYGRILIMKVIT